MLRIFCGVLLLICLSNQSKPNILFIVVDDLRPSLGVYGYKNAFTPNIDRLSKKSIVFNNAYAQPLLAVPVQINSQSCNKYNKPTFQQAVCAPSRNSFLTSRRPDTLKLYDFYSYWRDVAGNYTTLPQHFKENGYHTHSIGKVFHPGITSNWTDDAKYSWSDIPYYPPTEIYKEAKVCPTTNGSLAKNLVCPVVVNLQPGGNLPDLESLNAALEFLKGRENSVYGVKPYFLAVGFHKPHIPLKFPVEYLDFHPLEKIQLPINHLRPSLLPTVAWNPWTDVRQRDDIASLNIEFPFGTMPDFMAKKIIQNYDAAISYVDDLVGKLLRNIDNNTIVVLVGDHGWSLSEHGEFSKFSNFEVAVRVPLIIHIPNLTTENQNTISTNSLVELVDIFPTLVELTKVTDSLQVCLNSTTKLCTEGRSLVPLIVSTLQNKEYLGKAAVFNQYPRPGLFPTKNPNSDKPRLNQIKIMGYSMRTKKYRYTEWVSFDNKKCLPIWDKVYAKELYDYSIDINENYNLVGIAGMEAIQKSLSKELRLGWRFVK